MLKCKVVNVYTGEKLGEFDCTKDQLHILKEIFASYDAMVEVI